jgi:hypothetical protein
MFKSTISLLFVLVLAAPSMGGVVRAYLESAPGFSGGKFARVFSSGLHDPAFEYATLSNPALNEYPDAPMPDTFFSTNSIGSNVTGAGSSRITGRVAHGLSEVGIYTTAYSMVENGTGPDNNLVAGRLRIELDATDYNWSITNPLPELERSFKGFLTSDANGLVAAPVLLSGGGTYYFHFEYMSQVPGLTFGADFAPSSRQFDLVLTNSSVVPEPASMAVFGTLCVGGLVMRRRQKRATTV